MKALLIAGGVALLVAILGTPLLIGDLQGPGDRPADTARTVLRPLLQGRHTHHGWAWPSWRRRWWVTTWPTCSATFTTRGLVGMATICAAALVGFIDDWLKVTRQRSLGLNKRAKIIGQLVVAIGLRRRGGHLVEGGHPSVLHPLQLARPATGQGRDGRCSPSL